MFSFAETLYGPEISNWEYKKRMKNEFQNSNNMSRPLRCKIPKMYSSGKDAELMKVAYNLMLACWDLRPENRPVFGTLREDLDHAVDTGDWEGYFDEEIYTDDENDIYTNDDIEIYINWE